MSASEIFFLSIAAPIVYIAAKMTTVMWKSLEKWMGEWAIIHPILVGTILVGGAFWVRRGPLQDWLLAKFEIVGIITLSSVIMAFLSFLLWVLLFVVFSKRTP